ncbi:MAG: DUF1232 domain-containing protein [Rhodospirillaceae bacterium]|jgi:uncharacterized membrane protein YkvA (DUF1232 family)|nr:DUF1232 domain-containing protein [Rhodospirillaceae bacterium]
MPRKTPDSSQSETEKEADVRRKLPGKARRTLGNVPFVESAMAAWYCARDPATPKHVKAAIIGALAYFIMPIDAIPDVVILLGYTDDAAVFWAVWRTVSKYVTVAHRAQARAFFKDR